LPNIVDLPGGVVPIRLSKKNELEHEREFNDDME